MKNKSLIAFIIAVLIFVGGVAALKKQDSAPSMGTMMNTPVVNDGARNFSTSTIGTYPTQLLATSTSRLGATICHDKVTATTVIAYLHLASATTSIAASTTVATGEGYMLEQGECFSIPADIGFLYTGPVMTIASSSTTSFSIIEK